VSADWLCSTGRGRAICRLYMYRKYAAGGERCDSTVPAQGEIDKSGDLSLELFLKATPFFPLAQLCLTLSPFFISHSLCPSPLKPPRKQLSKSRMGYHETIPSQFPNPSPQIYSSQPPSPSMLSMRLIFGNKHTSTTSPSPRSGNCIITCARLAGQLG
jgi:hypothetical protein